MPGIWVQSLGWEDPLEKGMATHSSILAWRIPWTYPGVKELDTTERLSPTHSLTHGRTDGNLVMDSLFNIGTS